jgi:eukaryotic-like serine/threonine-protein kinase
MRERELFEAALDRTPVERARFLDGACAGDPSLRGRVESLLAQRAESKCFLEKPALAADLTEAYRSISEAPGMIIGPYKLLQRIGEGGFGSVFMAEQERPVRRMVALKIIKPGMDTAEVIARFESERQALALMDHPNIAKVLDAGATDSQRPYFVMELVRGVPITEFCDKNRMPAEARLRLFIDVCHAIQHAHHKGIIHRDVKPSNVMVTLHDGVPVVKVIDFGVAKATIQKLTEKTLFTAYGQMVGTPTYMSPEQAEMSGLDIDTRSDVYSLGVLLYELLTGTTPLEGKRLRQAGYAEMQRLIREEEAPRPSTRFSSLGDSATALAGNRGMDVKRLSQLLAGDLDWIVMKALEKNRNRRYDTPGNMAEDLHRYLNNEMVLARPPSTTYKLAKFARRNRGSILMSGLILGLLIAGIVGTSIGLYQAECSRDHEVRLRLAAESAKTEADDQRNAAVLAKRIAVESGEQNRRLRYSSDVLLASQAWQSEDGTAQQVESLLAGHIPPSGVYDLREFAWRMQWKQLKQGTQVFPNAGKCERVAISGDTVFSLDVDGTCLSWSNGIMTKRAFGDDRPTKGDLVIDGRRAAIVASTGRTQIIDPATGKVLRELDTSAPPVGLQFSDDGRLLVSVGANAQAKVWNVETGASVQELRLKSANFRHMAISNDGRMLALNDHTRGFEIALYRVGYDAPILLKDSVAQFNMYQPRISPDGRIVACGNAGGDIYLWDTATGSELCQLHVRSSALRLAFSPDSTLLATGEISGRIVVWDLAKRAQVSVHKGHTSAIRSLAFSRDGKSLISSADDRTLRRWLRERTMAYRTVPRSTIHSGVHGLVYSPNGRWLAVGNGSGVELIDRRNAWLARMIDDTGVWRIAFAPSGQWIAAGGFDGNVRLIDPESGRVLRTLERPVGISLGVGSLAVSPDGKRVAAGFSGFTRYSADYPDGGIAVWNVDDPKAIQTFRLASQVSAVAFAPDNTKLAAGTHSGRLRIWDTLKWKQVAEWSNPDDQPCGVVLFSRDGSSLFAGSHHNVILWDIATREIEQTLAGHADLVDCTVLSPDGRTLATTGWDHTIKLWDTRTFRELQTLRQHTSWVYSIAFAPDGNSLASGGVDGRLLEWVSSPIDSR